MAEDKKSFVLYADNFGLIKQLPDDVAGRLLKHIFAYVNDENPISDDLLLNIAFEPIKMALKRDLKKYEQIKEKRSLAGKKSAEQRKQNSTNITYVDFAKQTPTNPTVSDSDSDSVIDNDILLEKETKEKFSFRNELLNRGGSEKLIDDWLKVRKTKKATNSETALIGFINQVNISKKGINEILEICISKDWKGFEAKWLDNLQNKNLQNGTRQQPLLGRQSADTLKSNATGWGNLE